MIAICEKCKRRFNVELQEHYLGAMYIEDYIMCPNCGQKYIIAITNRKIRKLKDMVDIKRKKYQRERTEENKKDFLNSLKTFKKELDNINGK